MLGRAWAVCALLVLGATLSGCIGASDDEGGDDTAQQQGAKDGVLDANESVVAPDGRGEIAAFKETNKTEMGTGGNMHAHDYWGGETRKVIAQWDSGLIPIPLFPDGKAAGTAIADYDIPEPSLVYEGTSQLEIVFDKVCAYGTNLRAVREATGSTSCPAQHPAITIHVDYMTAADEPGAFRSAGKATPGQPLIIPVAPTEADMPHQTKSLWLFRIYTGEPNAWTYNLTITAVKGHEVVNWPPHPNLYADKTERVIVDGEFTTVSKGVADFYLYGSDPTWVYPDRVISYGTDRVDVEIEFIDFSSAAPVQPIFYYLDYKNASYLSKMGHGDSAGGHLKDEGTDGVTYRFTIPTDAQSYDTPYGQKSRWGFRFMARMTDDTTCPAGDFEQQTLQGCQYVPYELKYRMKVTAYGHSTAEGVEDIQEAAASGSRR